jgi:hypothetical protein
MRRTLVDLGFSIARIVQEDDGDTYETAAHSPRLEMFQPAQEGMPAQSVEAFGVETLKVLRQALSDEIDFFEAKPPRD